MQLRLLNSLKALFVPGRHVGPGQPLTYGSKNHFVRSKGGSHQQCAMKFLLRHKNRCCEFESMWNKKGHVSVMVPGHERNFCILRFGGFVYVSGSVWISEIYESAQNVKKNIGWIMNFFSNVS